jgi:hypothetical protein
VLVVLNFAAQAAGAGGGVTFGLKGGFNGANFYGDDTGFFQTRNGIIFGGYVEYALSDMFSVQSEVLYAMRGWTSDAYCYGLCDVKYSTNYIEIPVLVRINSPCGNVPGPYLLVGLAVGIKAGSDFQAEVLGIPLDMEAGEFSSRLSDPKGTDVGFILGGGVAVPVSKYKLVIEVRGNGGLTDAYEDVELNGTTDKIDAKNVTGALMLGVEF